MKHFAGLDWGNVEHAACVVDEQGAVITQLVVEHTAAGLGTLCKRLAEIGPAASIPVCIERPSGLVVDTLVAAGHPVVPIHPNALKACRPRYRAAGGKSDVGDAYILADVLRTDGHRLRPLHPASDEVRALRALVRSRDDLVAERVAVANQLRALLESFWAGGAKVFHAVDCAISLTFLEEYPTPTSAKQLGIEAMGEFLARNRYPGRGNPAAKLARLRAAPVGLAGPLEERAKGEAVLDLVAVLKALVSRVRRLTKAIQQAVAELPAGRIIMSFPRAGKLNAAQILAELGDDPQRFQTADQLAAEAGVAPVTHASGKRRGVKFRYACNKRLRQAITTWADNSRHACPWAKAIYDAAVAREKDHPHAVRILARAWVRVLWRCWRDGVPYEPARHGAAKAFLQAA